MTRPSMAQHTHVLKHSTAPSFSIINTINTPIDVPICQQSLAPCLMLSASYPHASTCSCPPNSTHGLWNLPRPPVQGKGSGLVTGRGRRRRCVCSSMCVHRQHQVTRLAYQNHCAWGATTHGLLSMIACCECRTSRRSLNSDLCKHSLRVLAYADTSCHAITSLTSLRHKSTISVNVKCIKISITTCYSSAKS